jgi:nitrite reductase (NADH) large subunit
LLDDAWYRDQNIELVAGETVVDIDRREKRLTTASGRAFDYDKLILATGSRAHVPDIPGVEAAGVMAFRTIDDLHRIRDRALKGQARAVVIGGGLLGLEAAHGLNELGVDVTVVHRQRWLMNRQLDEEAGELLQSALQDRGIQFRLAASPAAVLTASGGAAGVELDSGDTLSADLVLFAAGIDPNKELGEKAGLDVGRGVVVDEFLGTSDPDIHALGECAELDGNTFGLVAPIYRQADILARKLAGKPTAGFVNEPSVTQLKVSGIELFSAGAMPFPEAVENQILRDGARGIYRRLVFSGDKLIGAVLLGDRSGGNWLEGLIRDCQPVTPLRPWMLFGSSFGAANG